MKRDYKKEYRQFHGKSKQIKLRNLRNKARKLMKQKKGNGYEVDHIKPLSRGGTNARSNLRVVKRRVNRRKGAKAPKSKK